MSAGLKQWAIDYAAASRWIAGKSVVIVGSAPSVLKNTPGFIDSHDVVVRVNNYKNSDPAGWRTDIYYSYFGNAIRKTAKELAADGVDMCMCKCPNSKPIDSHWHEANNKQAGIDFRYIYTMRDRFWFCPTFVPTDDHFLESFELLGRRIPTTGFAAIYDVLGCRPNSLHLTGFDFFTSKIHNVDEQWRPGNPNDPIGHSPQAERGLIQSLYLDGGVSVDEHMQGLLGH